MVQSRRNQTWHRVPTVHPLEYSILNSDGDKDVGVGNDEYAVVDN